MHECLRVSGLTKYYRSGRLRMAAVSQVSFAISAGECVGLVGESGSGKSTLVRLLLALVPPDEGDVSLMGESLVHASRRRLLRLRQHVQVVFQDATASLNDRLPIWRSVIEPLDNYPDVCPSFMEGSLASRRDKAERLLHMVGLTKEHMDRYPHELSGGQRQRACIARGISLSPRLLICDEPTSSLDVTTQRQILELLQMLQRQLGMSVLFISHDIAAVASLCSRLLVMQAGRIVDSCGVDELWDNCRHDYTRMLLSAAH